LTAPAILAVVLWADRERVARMRRVAEQNDKDVKHRFIEAS
jgi:hypothetical protein